MHQPNITLWFECKDESLSVRHFEVREAMNAPFEIELLAVSHNDDLDLEAFVGHKARFSVKGKHHRELEGFVQSMRLVKAESTGQSTYKIHIVPRLWILLHRTDNRIFQNVSIPEILRQVMRKARVEFAYRLEESSYPKHEYRVQYEETDYAFLSRLCEEAGIAFFFDENSMLTFSDAPQNAAPRDEAVPYHPARHETHFEERFDAIELRDEVRPARYTLRDHDFRRRPDFELFGNGVEEHSIEGELENYHYRPGATWVLTDDASNTPAADDRSVARASVDEGHARATRKLEAIRAGKFEALLHGNVLDLSPGVVFKVTRHPHREIPSDRALLVVASKLSGDANDNWTAEYTAHFADFAYRPPHKTKKPRIVGVQSAIVVGPAGEEIYTDEFGRVRVQFHWDREGTRDEKSSCWVRVSQGWAGGGQGMIVLPRIGQEVFVVHLDGDPDRPVILGRCFNATAVVPHTLPGNKTQSAWRSETSPRNGGYNEIMLEDKAGEELFQMHAQKDMQTSINNDSNTNIGNSLGEVIGNMKDLFVGTNQTTTIGVNDFKSVGTNYKVEIPPPAMAGGQSVGAAAAAGLPTPGTTTPSEGPGTSMQSELQPGPPTHQDWKYNNAELTANNSTILLQQDLTIKTEGNMRIEAKGTVTIVGSIIHLNP